jgi:rhodanese-related sulfurtransferase
MGAIESIGVKELATRLKSGGALAFFDVRSPAEHRSCHAVGTRNLPLDKLGQKQCQDLCAEAKGGPVYLICKSGQRAKAAAEKIAARGDVPIYLVEGGTDAWVAAGLPVVEGKGSISIERQVRIAAGSLVVLGIVLSLLAHPLFIGLSAFVGCGLVFAGITDTCMMGMMLAKMPWNR